MKLVAKRADERACMRIPFFIRGNVGIGASRGGGERRRQEREGEEVRMRKEREASNGFREREERQNAVAIPVRCCRVSRIFSGSDDENSHGKFVRFSRRVARRRSWISSGRAVS